MRVTSPVSVKLTKSGVWFAESAHDSGFTMTERSDAFHKVLYVLAGKAELRRNGSSRGIVCGAGGVLLVDAGTSHTLTDLEPATILLLCFSPRWLGNVPDLARLWPVTLRRTEASLTLPGATRLRVESLWRRALFEQGRAQPGAEAIVFACAAEIVAQLARTELLTPGHPAELRIRALAAEVAGSFMEKWTIDAAAARVAMSRRSFTSYFRAQMGTSFWDYLERLRVDHAARLLRDGEHTVVGVMFSSGFTDLTTFYRAFRRRHGTSPKRWCVRAQARA